MRTQRNFMLLVCVSFLVLEQLVGSSASVRRLKCEDLGRKSMTEKKENEGKKTIVWEIL